MRRCCRGGSRFGHLFPKLCLGCRRGRTRWQVGSQDRRLLGKDAECVNSPIDEALLVRVKPEPKKCSMRTRWSVLARQAGRRSPTPTHRDFFTTRLLRTLERLSADYLLEEADPGIAPRCQRHLYQVSSPPIETFPHTECSIVSRSVLNNSQPSSHSSVAFHVVVQGQPLLAPGAPKVQPGSLLNLSHVHL